MEAQELQRGQLQCLGFTRDFGKPIDIYTILRAALSCIVLSAVLSALNCPLALSTLICSLAMYGMEHSV